MSEPRFLARYEIRVGPGEDPVAKVEALCLEQTAELPSETLPDPIAAEWIGRCTSLEPLGDGLWLAGVSFPEAVAGGELTQLLNLLFGNSSLQSGIRLVGVDWPAGLLACLGGPALGIAGLRTRLRVHDGPLLATALKPVGLDAASLAQRCEAFARGGLDLIKDDHGLADQRTAPFAERLARCQAAVTRANAATGGQARYCPNVTAGPAELDRRAEAARAAGCDTVLLNAWIAGLAAVAHLRDAHGLAVLAHPALTGGLLRPDHGIDTPVLLGELFRIAGADAVIYPNAGGRFAFSEARCLAIAERLRAPLGGLRGAWPMPGGGMSMDAAPQWAARYGADTIFLIGGDLYRAGDLTTAAQRFRAALEERHE
ncbi:RuBisCO large subunit C-terminal-like domain-containing protein [Spiribacter halobius]|uniref:Ribulose 1,5-bisphosphate carboxylase n=1 Tax=Sediminicurvatus halobius TaxID=2182432 RepID=A0A2U2N4A9_9GAMM|nr:RuBisCO large subunit C-terminal-like domain-containing protein [Spiribacter halobius]PWG63858.1 ribulose 1,5-bisphosphate carboxylase [Spiribacter halobius]UEX76261.1 RuBisCO large subunit C-terminal-like domain-containing protein [Spiribacter halobius]